MKSLLFYGSAILIGWLIGSAIFIAFIRPVLAEEQTAALAVTVTVTEPPLWIVADDAEEVTISTEDAMAYCYAHGLEMHECRIDPAELAEWSNSK